MQISYNRSKLKKVGQILPFIMLAYILFDLILNKKLYFSIDFLQSQTWGLSRSLIIVPVFLLMLINWLLEAVKWQLLTKKYYTLTIKRSFMSVWSGVSTAFFTPNRLGDFIGRVSHLPKGERKNGIVSSAYGSYSQWLLTLSMGWLAWVQLGDQFIRSEKAFLLLSFFSFILLVALFVLFFGKGSTMLLKQKWQEHLKYRPSKEEKTKLIVLSALRYLVFTSQFYLLLLFLGVELDYGLVLSKLGIFYLIASLLPSTFWGELGVKESLAVWIFSGLIINSFIIIAATFLLWMINLLIPAIMGNYFLYKRNKTHV